MKSLAEAETALKNELRQWCNKQGNDLHTAYYLYFLPTTAEHDGRLLIATDPPANSNYQLACTQRISPGSTVEQNFNFLRLNVLRQLPILT